MKFTFLSVAALAGVLACAAPAPAQSADRSHWGVSAGLAPRWTFLKQLETLVDGGEIDATGSDFRLGIVRGRDLGGEWGVSLIRKSFRDGSSFSVDDGLECFNNQCARSATVNTVQKVTMTGVLVHKYVPFATIKRRAQIGMSFAGGVASTQGTLVERGLFPQFNGGRVTQGESVTEVQAREFFAINPFPLAQVEVAASALVAPGMKVRVSGGLNFPGSQTFALSVSYLIGAR